MFEFRFRHKSGLGTTVKQVDGSAVIERAAHSYAPIYFHTDDQGRTTVTDTMALLLPSVRDRQLDERALLHHLLQGRSPGRSYLSSVGVVDHGERVTIKPDGTVDRFIYDRFEHHGRDHYSAAIPALRDLLHASVNAAPIAANLFSGGVDSTIIQAMGAAAPVNAAISSPEFEPETTYAKEAAATVARELRTVSVDEASYLDMIVEATRRTGTPVPAIQHPLLDAIFTSMPGPFGFGYLADGIFGLGVSGRAKSTQDFLFVNSRPDNESFDDRIEKVLGPIHAFHQDRQERAEARIDQTNAKSDFARLLTLGHTIDYLGDDSIAFTRDLAASRGVVIHAPYNDRTLIDRFHACDPETRYVDGGRSKPVLKDILRSLVPAYAVDKAKLGSGLPRSRYFTEGPFKGAFEKYPPPEPLASIVGDAAANPTWANSWILWPALSYSIWFHECVRR